MAEILDFYKKNKSIPTEILKAEEYLLKDTLSKNLTRDKKIKELDGMDMESKLSGKIMPSMIYTFIYDTKQDMQLEDNIVFGDKMPIVLCCDIKPMEKMLNGKLVNSLQIIGINLNFLKNDDRAIFLDKLYSAFSTFYKNIYKDVYENKASINKQLSTVLNNKNFVNLVYTLTKVDISKCVRTYNVSFAKNIRLIEYNLWKYIPLYDAKRTVTNISIKGIQEIMSKK